MIVQNLFYFTVIIFGFIGTIMKISGGNLFLKFLLFIVIKFGGLFITIYAGYHLLKNLNILS